MNYKLKVLSPLHIGCGEKYSSLNYVLDDGKMYCIDQDRFISAVGENRIGKFVKWIEECSNNLDRLESRKNVLKRNTDTASRNEVRTINNKLMPQQRQAFTLRKFIDDNKMDLKQIIKDALYSVTVQRNVRDYADINPFVKQMNHPYIPGTEIKGAIRTAVLYCTLMDQKNLSDKLLKSIKAFGTQYKDEIDLVKNEKKLKKKNPNNNKETLGDIKKKLEAKMRDIAKEFQENALNTDAKDAKFDIMKYVHAGDSELLNAGESLAVSYVTPYNISQYPPPKIFYEYLKPEAKLISLTSLFLASEKFLNTKIDNQDMLGHMGFNKEQKTIVSGIDKILKYCHRFSNDLLAEEISFYSAHGKQQIAEQLERIKTLNKPDFPVLRIGKDEGYNSLTVGLAVKKLDKPLYENVLIHTTKNISYDSTRGGPLPKSRKIVYWNGEETTAGWVQLIPENLSENQETCEKHTPYQAAQNRKPAVSVDTSKLESKFQVRRKK